MNPAHTLENCRAKVQNLEAGTHYQLRKLARDIGCQAVIDLTGEPEWFYYPMKYVRTERLAEALRNGCFPGLTNEQRHWLKALAAHYLLLHWAMTQKPDLTDGYVGRLWRLTNRNLNAMCDWRDGNQGSGYERIFF